MLSRDHVNVTPSQIQEGEDGDRLEKRRHTTDSKKCGDNKVLSLSPLWFIFMPGCKIQIMRQAETKTKQYVAQLKQRKPPFAWRISVSPCHVSEWSGCVFNVCLVVPCASSVYQAGISVGLCFFTISNNPKTTVIKIRLNIHQSNLSVMIYEQ